MSDKAIIDAAGAAYNAGEPITDLHRISGRYRGRELTRTEVSRGYLIMPNHPRDFQPLGWEIRDAVEAAQREPKRAEGIAYLTLDGPHLACPCSRYGRTSEDCAPTAWRLAYIIARDGGEPLTFKSLDYCMGLVVNDHDDVAYMIRNYGGYHYV